MFLLHDKLILQGEKRETSTKNLGAIAEYPATLVHLIYMCQNLL